MPQSVHTARTPGREQWSSAGQRCQAFFSAETQGRLLGRLEHRLYWVSRPNHTFQWPAASLLLTIFCPMCLKIKTKPTLQIKKQFFFSSLKSWNILSRPSHFPKSQTSVRHMGCGDPKVKNYCCERRSPLSSHFAGHHRNPLRAELSPALCRSQGWLSYLWATRLKRKWKPISHFLQQWFSKCGQGIHEIKMTFMRHYVPFWLSFSHEMYGGVSRGCMACDARISSLWCWNMWADMFHLSPIKPDTEVCKYKTMPLFSLTCFHLAKCSYLCSCVMGWLLLFVND